MKIKTPRGKSLYLQNLLNCFHDTFTLGTTKYLEYIPQVLCVQIVLSHLMNQETKRITQPGFICSKSTIEMADQCVKYVRNVFFIINFEWISHFILVILLLPLKK